MALRSIWEPSDVSRRWCLVLRFGSQLPCQASSPPKPARAWDPRVCPTTPTIFQCFQALRPLEPRHRARGMGRAETCGQGSSGIMDAPAQGLHPKSRVPSHRPSSRLQQPSHAAAPQTPSGRRFDFAPDPRTRLDCESISYLDVHLHAATPTSTSLHLLTTPSHSVLIAIDP
jgi:hypothetical protein